MSRPVLPVAKFKETDYYIQDRQVWVCEVCRKTRYYGLQIVPEKSEQRAMLVCSGTCRDGHGRTHTWHRFIGLQSTRDGRVN